MAKINPLKYRGYYHDAESGFYYLQSRYYDPAIGRFINADGQIALDGSFLNTNQFAYCGNNPVNQVDPEGEDYLRALYRVLRLLKLVSNKAYKRLNMRWNAKYDRMSGTSTRNRLINDQNGTTGQTFTYGACYAQKNACETIAVHNAKVLLGIDSTLSDTMAAFQDANAMMAFGYLGSDPLRIGTVLRNEGIQYTRIRLDEMDKPGTYIISFWNDKPLTEGLHTVAVSYDGTGYTTYNRYGDGKLNYQAPASYARNSYICGYYLG